MDGRLRYASIDTVTNTELRSSATVKDPLIDYWNGYAATLGSTGGSVGLSNAKMSGGLGLALSASEKAFVSNAVLGMLMSGLLAFLVMVLSTFNVVVSVYAMIAIAGIIVSVVAIIGLQEWEFGVTESISVVILIGFSGTLSLL